MNSSVQRRNPGPRQQAPEGRETSRERHHRLLDETETALAAIDDVLTVTRCQLGRD